MHYRNLGQSGCKVSVLSLGSWLTLGGSVEQAVTNDLVATAFEHGINTFDTADIYARGAAESALGLALAPLRREHVVLATKAFWPMSEDVNDRGLSRKHLFESCHASLRRLRTDYIDLYQCHRPDPGTPCEETVRALEDLVRQGKILYWGVSVWSAEQIEEACAIADRTGGYRPISNQPEYSLLRREIEADIVPTCTRLGLGQIVWSPLAQGLLTGKYKGGVVPPGSRGADPLRNRFLQPLLVPDNLALAERVATAAGKLGVTPAQLALAWVLAQPGISSAIVGATRREQLLENLGAAELEVPADVLAQLGGLVPVS